MSTVQATNVTCPHCGRTNRVPVAAEGRPRCGNCKQPLPWTADAGDDDFTEVVEQATVPVVVDAGIGAPSQAAEAIELGASAVLVNTAISIAGDPVRMAAAFRKAVEAAREGVLAGLPAVSTSATASSPLTGFLSKA